MKPVTIVGGGVAGLTVGIGLRQRDVPVTVWEAGHYPRHRVCGEFISGSGQQMLARLGLGGALEAAGAQKAETAAFFSLDRSTGSRTLPRRAIGLSRFKLDALLAEKFRELGGQLLEGRRREAADFGEGMVRATGRHAQAEADGVRWFGLKAHARGVPLAADLEMHISSRGYVGLCRVEGGKVNVCGLFRRRSGEPDRVEDRQEWLRGLPGAPLRQKMAAAEFDEGSFCAVAGLSLRPCSAVNREDCCLGDAITMIPPVTGNGMSMAFESAELALEPLAGWSRGEISWTDARRQIARACDAAFARRLVWAKWLQRLLLAPALQNALVLLAARSDGFWRLAFEKTR
ncbi:MAG TPA: hypothetical protein VMB80_16000 [Candidatus Acidoferrum sp.]|nr:hypothetical protein [Candidatus Acidoferrum sp.]